MTLRFDQPSLRPAPAALPPTLQPRAVLALAPPTDRRRSAAVSAAVYALLAGGMAWMAHAGTTLLKPRALPSGPTVLFTPAPPAAAPAARLQTAAKPAETPALVKPSEPQAIPAETPAAMPTENHSAEPPTTATSPSTGTTGTGGGEPISVSADALRVLHQVNPAYPAMAVAAHLQGQVVLRMTIDERGVPTQVDAVSGPQVFQGPAIRAAQQWRFQPATQNGQATPATFLLTLNFVLR